MNAISVRQKHIGPSATSMNGRTRPGGVWKVSLHGPITSGSVRAKIPSEPRMRPINPPESVNLERNGGRYAAVVVIENASPKAPNPSVQTSARGCDRPVRGGSVTSSATSLAYRRGYPVEAADEHVDDGALGPGDLVVPVRQLAEHPGGQDLLERAVDDRRGEPRVELGPELAVRLPPGDDALDHAEGLAHVLDSVLELAAPRDLSDEHGHELRRVAPRAQEDRTGLAQLLGGGLVAVGGGSHRLEQLAPGLAEDGLEQVLLRSEVVVEEPVGHA